MKELFTFVVLKAMDSESSSLPTILTDYILKGKYACLLFVNLS